MGSGIFLSILVTVQVQMYTPSFIFAQNTIGTPFLSFKITDKLNTHYT